MPFVSPCSKLNIESERANTVNRTKICHNPFTFQ